MIPSFEAFEQGWARGENQLVYSRLAADLDTPVSLMLKLAEAQPMSFMLESVTGGEVRGRYSVVGLKPDVIWECRGEPSRINRQARFDAEAFEDLPGYPLATLRYASSIADAQIILQGPDAIDLVMVEMRPATIDLIAWMIGETDENLL